MKTVQYIYVLIDPRNQSIFYVGITIDTKRRINQYNRIAVRDENPLYPWSASELRVRDIAASGYQVVFHVVETVVSDTWNTGYKAEKLWMARLVNSGVKLLNVDGVKIKKSNYLLDKCV